MLTFDLRHYATTGHLLDAVAASWITADGMYSTARVRKILAVNSDEDLADGCIASWKLDHPDAGEVETLKRVNGNESVEAPYGKVFAAKICLTAEDLQSQSKLSRWKASRDELIDAIREFREAFDNEVAYPGRSSSEILPLTQDGP